MNLKFLVAMAAVAASLSGVAFSAPEADKPQVIQQDIKQGIIDVIPNVVYSQVKTLRSNRPLRMTVLVPQNDLLKPAIIYFPGGGMMNANYEKFLQMRLALAEAGFVVASAEYRTIPDQFPAIINDAKAAVRYLRAHAKEYGIDPNRIGVLGDSAGGYLAMLTGTTGDETQWDKGDFLDQKSDVQAVASIFGLSDLRNVREGFSEEVQKVHESPAVVEALMINGPAFDTKQGLSLSELGDRALEASPIGHVKGGEPPFLLLHGDKDSLVSPVQSQQMYDALKAKNGDVQYYILEGAGHGDIGWYQPNVIKIVTDWFEQKLGKPIEPTEAQKMEQPKQETTSSGVPKSNL